MNRPLLPDERAGRFCTFAKVSTRVIDSKAAQCLHEFPPDKSIEETTMATLCLIPVPLANEPETGTGGTTNARRQNDGESEVVRRLSSSRGVVGWAVVRGRGDGMLQVMPTISVAKEKEGGDVEGDTGEGREVGSGTEMADQRRELKRRQPLKLGETSLIFLQWLALPHVRKIFNKPEHAAAFRGTRLRTVCVSVKRDL